MAFNTSTVCLETRRPSPTTVLYKVSNAAPRISLPSKLSYYFQSLARITLFLWSALHLYARLRLALAPTPLHPLSTRIDILIAHHTPIFSIAVLFGQILKVPIDVLVALLVVWICSSRDHVEESLLLIRGLGIQTSSSSRYYGFEPTTRFIPTPQMQDIFIHEAFKGFEVRFYLAVVVEGEEEAVVVFPKLLPKRQILEEVWRGAKACLYEPAKIS